jgi:hypothetical protein
MSDDDEFEDEPELEEELDEEELVADFDDDDDDLLVDDLEVVDEVELEVPDPVTPPDDEVLEAETEEDDDDIVDLEEELHPDDVEEALDVVLRERTAKAGLEDEEDEELEPDDRGEAGTRIVPRRPGEFLCSSCFLVLPRHQLADEKRMLCRDCA